MNSSMKERLQVMLVEKPVNSSTEERLQGMSGKKPVNLSMQQRLQVLEDLEELSIAQVAAKHNVHPMTIRRIQSRRDHIHAFANKSNKQRLRKRERKPVFKELEEKLFHWFTEERDLGGVITDSILLQKASELKKIVPSSSNAKISKGWLTNFKRRHEIHLARAYTEKASADEDRAKAFLENLEIWLEENEVDIENIYNMGETGLLWKALPNKTVACGNRVGEAINPEDRVTLGLCANATGTNKLMPLFICKYENPATLKHCLHRLPVVFYSNKKAWIDEALFVHWYENQFKPTVRAHQLRKGICGKVLLLLDHCSAHQIPHNEQDADKFKIMYLPPNTSSLIQPMDQGIIEKTKNIYRKHMLRSVLTYETGIEEFSKDFTIKDCIDTVGKAWSEVTDENIKNGWNKIIEVPYNLVDDTDDEDLEDLIYTIWRGDISRDEAAAFLASCAEDEQENICAETCNDENGAVEDSSNEEVNKIENEYECDTITIDIKPTRSEKMKQIAERLEQLTKESACLSEEMRKLVEESP